MASTPDIFSRKRELLEESCVLIERLKKLRALNADPRLLGINPRLRNVEGSGVIIRAIKRFR
ncbi:MAG: hypothetical protein ABH843_06710 [Candidatus Omnitrophota bacterium]